MSVGPRDPSCWRYANVNSARDSSSPDDTLSNWGVVSRDKRLGRVRACQLLNVGFTPIYNTVPEGKTDFEWIELNKWFIAQPSSIFGDGTDHPTFVLLIEGAPTSFELNMTSGPFMAVDWANALTVAINLILLDYSIGDRVTIHPMPAFSRRMAFRPTRTTTVEGHTYNLTFGGADALQQSVSKELLGYNDNGSFSNWAFPDDGSVSTGFVSRLRGWSPGIYRKTIAHGTMTRAELLTAINAAATTVLSRSGSDYTPRPITLSVDAPTNRVRLDTALDNDLLWHFQSFAIVDTPLARQLGFWQPNLVDVDDEKRSWLEDPVSDAQFGIERVATYSTSLEGPNRCYLHFRPVSEGLSLLPTMDVPRYVSAMAAIPIGATGERNFYDFTYAADAPYFNATIEPLNCQTMNFSLRYTDGSPVEVTPQGVDVSLKIIYEP